MKRILVTGGTGMIGTALKQHIPDAIFVSSKEANLTSPTETQSLIATIGPRWWGASQPGQLRLFLL